MSQLLCVSLQPFQLIYNHDSFIHEILPPLPNQSIEKKFKCFEDPKHVFVKSFQKIFILSKNYICEYNVCGRLELKTKIRLNHKFLHHATYFAQNKMIYCVDDYSLFLINNNKICCSFPNIGKYSLDNFRFFSLDTKHFLIILQYYNFCIYHTKKMIENILKVIWRCTNSLKIKFQCIHKDQFIFLVENRNKRKSIAMVDNKSLALEVIDIESIVGNHFFEIVQDTFLYLIVYIPTIHNVYLFYHVLESNTIFPIFEHSFSYPNSEDIEKCQFYFFHNEHYVLTIAPERKRVIRLFEIQEKLKSSFQFEKNENKYLKSQLQYFTSILYRKTNRIENDTMNKTLGKCCICYENNVSILFLPCSHICSCSNCGMLENVKSCPLCREIILLKKTTFILSK